MYERKQIKLNNIWNAFLKANNINNKDFHYQPHVKTMDQVEELPPFTCSDEVFLQSVGIRI